MWTKPVVEIAKTATVAVQMDEISVAPCGRTTVPVLKDCNGSQQARSATVPVLEDGNGCWNPGGHYTRQPEVTTPRRPVLAAA
jgi:hypothetical protein